MENDSHDALFYLSRATIIIPLFVIVFALFFLWDKKSASQSVASDILSPTPPPATSFDLSKVDLDGPLTCNYSAENLEVQGFIENKKIFARIEQQKESSYYLLNGDCLYSWKNGTNIGQKSCGLNTYLSTFDMVKSFPISIPIDPNVGNGLLSSCIKKPVTDRKVFTIPKNIQFKEAPLEMPSFLK